ncbi:MAG: light-harvesting antenna LH1, beta subunit [Hyphomonas sp.]
MADNANERTGTLTGLTASEAQEFHKLFVMSFIIFTLIAVGAHFLVWSWRPWIPGPGGYAMIEDTLRLASSLVSFKA